MILANLTVTGRARTKGSLDAVRRPNGSTYMRENNPQSKPWRAKVARACREYQLAEFEALLRFDGPVTVRCVFFLPRTESVNGGPVPTSSTLWPTSIVTGDTDKLLRNVGDALLKPSKKADAPYCSALIEDDSQIVSWFGLKIWCLPEYEAAQARILVLGQDTTPEVPLLAERDVWAAAGVKL
jgi:hypothetical protein